MKVRESLHNQYESVCKRLFQEKKYEVQEFSHDQPFDLSCRKGNECLLVELKVYSTVHPSSNDIFRVCQNLNEYKNKTKLDSVKKIFIITCVIEESLKGKIKKVYNIDVWDLKKLKEEVIEVNSKELQNEYEKLEANILVNQFFNEQEYSKNIKFSHVPNNLTIIQPKIDYKKKLDNIPTGNAGFQEFEDWCKEVFEYLFDNNLAELRAQNITDDGLFRYDLVSRINSMDNVFWQMMISDFHSRYLVVECKNYSEKITQAQVFTTEKYLYKTALRNVCFLVCRKGYDSHSEVAVKGILRESGKLIILLSAEDLLEMVKKVDNGEPATDYLFQKLDDFLIEIGK